MTVLPDQATFLSFFLVLICVMVVTIFLTYNLQHFVRHSQTVSNTASKALNIDLSWLSWSFIPAIPRLVFLELPTEEMSYAIGLFSRPHETVYSSYRFRFGRFVGDIMRLLLFPMWLTIATCLLVGRCLYYCASAGIPYCLRPITGS